MKRICQRIVSGILVLSIMLTLLPATALAAFGVGKHSETYDESIIATLMETTGSREAAIEVLDRLYSAGFIDETGRYLDNPIFDVDGEKVAADVLLEMAEQHGEDDPVTVDGEATTWGVLHKYIELAKTIALLYELRDSDVEITEEHQNTLTSLLEAFNNGIHFDNSATAALMSEEHPSWPATALTHGTLDRKLNQKNQYYVEGNYAGAGGYSTEHQFVLPSQKSTEWYTDSRYDGSGIDPKARITMSTSVVPANEGDPITVNQNATITVTATLDTPQPAPVSFEYRTVGGSWTKATGEGTVTWAAGESGNKTFQIAVNSKDGSSDTCKGKQSFVIQAYSVVNAKFAGDSKVWEQRAFVNVNDSIPSPSGIVRQVNSVPDMRGRKKVENWSMQIPGTIDANTNYD